MLKRIKSRVAALSLMVVSAIVMLPAMALATPTVEDEIGTAFGDIQTLVIGTIAAAFFALLVVVVGLRVGARWFKRGASS